jgi:16S rRNA (guanine527-N7)-methyltransferase
LRSISTKDPRSTKEPSSPNSSLVDQIATLLREAAVAPKLIEPLALYGAMVLDARHRFNLTGATSAPELTMHLLDSLTVLPYVHEPYVDVGSGAGFPAIPVGIATGIPITLIESTVKRARFLESTLERMGLQGTVIGERAERAARRENLRQRFASGTARAIGTAPTVAELLVPFIARNGAAVLQRGRIDPHELQSLEDATLMLGGRIEAEVRLNGDRRLIIVRKDSPTPDRFPRRVGVPTKRPLCS